MMVSTIRRVITAFSAIVAVAGMAACDANQIGAAVVVGDSRLTVSELQDQVEQVQAIEGFDAAMANEGVSGLQSVLLTRHIQHELFLKLAGDQDIEISEAAIDDAIEDFESSVPTGDVGLVLAQDGYMDIRTAFRDQLIMEAYAEKTGSDKAALTRALQDISEEIGVEVNPRYGTWGDDLTVTADSGSISTVAGENVVETPPAGSDR